jgi:hypothetical protein
MLGKENIHIIASTVADTSDYGILRLITSNQHKALSVLAQHHVTANSNEVLAIEVSADAQKMAELIEMFTKAGINIEYMYSFTVSQKAIVVLRTKNLDTACDVVRKNGLAFVSDADLLKM